MKNKVSAIVLSILLISGCYMPVIADDSSFSAEPDTDVIAAEDNTEFYFDKSDNEEPLINIENAVIDPVDKQYYTGSPLMPHFKVTFSGKVLTQGVDYVAVYVNNRNIGTATAYILGKGAYNGSVMKTFDIVPKQTVGKISELKSKDVGETSLTLTWKAASNADYYNVEIIRSGNKSENKKVKDTSLKVTNLSAGEKIAVTVTPVADNGNFIDKGLSESKKFTTKPSQVKNFKVTQNEQGAVSFKWDKVNNNDGYEIQYSDKKDSGYKQLKLVDKDKTTLKATNMPTGKKLYYKIRALSKADGNTQSGKYSSTVYTIAFNKKTINQVLSGYSNSRSVKQVNGQGYKISDKNKNKLKNALTYLGGDAGYIIYDIDSGSTVLYNANTYFQTASTAKFPYIMYCLKQMDKGNGSMGEMLTYRQSDYNGGSGWIKYQRFGSKYSIKRVMELIGEYSDNCGYYMLQDRFGFDGYNKFIKSLGCRPTISRNGNRWGWISACDSSREWIEMNKYFKNGKHKTFAKNLFATTCASNFRSQLGRRYTVYAKSGWTNINYNETALVNAKHPYIIVCLTTRTNVSRMKNVAEISESIHNEMWNYYNKK